MVNWGRMVLNYGTCSISVLQILISCWCHIGSNARSIRGQATGLGVHFIALTVCLFKTRLDKFWMHQDVMYDFTADLTGIGDRSVREIS